MKFSELSQIKLATCDNQLIALAHKAIENSPYDFMITHGHRSIAMQLALYNKGREYVNDKWVIVDPKKVVTNCDGIKIKSKHNNIPSLAFDIAVLIDGKITWEGKYYNKVAEHIISIAKELTLSGILTRSVRWGGIFKNYDGPHYELV